MKNHQFWPRQRGGLLSVAIVFISGGIVSAELEAWQSATVGTQRPQDESLVTIDGDMGIWLVADTASSFPEDGPTPNTAEIGSDSGNKYLTLTSADGNIWAVLHHLITPLSIPITHGKQIAIVEGGSLDDPHWSGYHPGNASPNGTSVSMTLEDNNGNRLVYIFQRADNYPQHTQTYQGMDAEGNIVDFGYHEIFLGTPESAGGTYVRDIFQDFSEIPHFQASGAQIIQISFDLSDPGTATLRMLEIANQLTPIPPIITQQPAAPTLTAGDPCMLECQATGIPSPTYQWQRRAAGTGSWVNVVDDATYSGAAGGQLTIASTTTAMTGDRFRCQVSTGGTPTTSGEVILIVDPGTPPEPPILRPYALSNGFAFEWDSTFGVNYQVQSSINGVSWQNEGGIRNGTGGLLSFDRTWPAGDPPAGQLFKVEVITP